MARREPDFEPMPLDPRVERAVLWLRGHVPGAEPFLIALERETTAGGTLIAGGLAYRLFLWLLPFGLVTTTLASFWQGDVESSAEDDLGLSHGSAETMSDVIQQSSHGRWYFLLLGLFFLLWFAIGVVRALRVAHTVAWGVRRERFRRPLNAGAFFTLFAAVLIGSTLVAQWARETLGVAGLVATISMVAFYAAAALWAMLILPHGDAPWTAVLPGAVLVGIGIEGLHVFAALYLVPRLGRSGELYGSLGAATVILLWLYIIARLITLSAFLNATIWERHEAAG